MAKIASLTLHQRDVIGEGRLWPIATQVMLGYANAAACQASRQFKQAPSRVWPRPPAKAVPDLCFCQ